MGIFLFICLTHRILYISYQFDKKKIKHSRLIYIGGNSGDKPHQTASLMDQIAKNFPPKLVDISNCSHRLESGTLYRSLTRIDAHIFINNRFFWWFDFIICTRVPEKNFD